MVVIWVNGAARDFIHFANTQSCMRWQNTFFSHKQLRIVIYPMSAASPLYQPESPPHPALQPDNAYGINLESALIELLIMDVAQRQPSIAHCITTFCERSFGSGVIGGAHLMLVIAGRMPTCHVVWPN